MSDRRAAYDEESLPWLEAVASEDAPRGVSGRKMLAAVLLVFVAIALIASTFFLAGRRTVPTDGDAPELIRADPRPYKVKPTDPGGLDVAGDSQTAFATSAGADTDAQIDLNAVAEAPVARPVAPPPAPPPAPAAVASSPSVKSASARPEPIKPAAVVTPAPPPTGTGGSGVIQLGAFSTAAKAEAAWKALSGRFASLAAMTKIVIPVTSGGGTSLYRLRAGAGSPGAARAMCQALRVAGESCVVIG